MVSLNELGLMEKRKRSLLLISWVAPALALVAAIFFWNDPPMLSAIAAAILLLMTTALYLVERSFSRALIAALRRLET